MDSDRWGTIQSHFHRCLQMSLGEQETFIKNLEDEDSALADEVKKLLNGHSASGAFLEVDVLEEAFINSGDMVGPWKIIREIGRGGMSTVYLAFRADGQFEREAAIKFLHGLIPGRSMHKRIQLEQNILARLQHKNISQLFDAGLSDDGRPYFILEYIDGKPITEWCSGQELSFSKRLKIFEQVCEAVQFAHQRLIVHRDLKPTNILVDKNGKVKLLDFGIAKILEEDPQEGAPLTRTGQYLMTPEYASPEQVHGAPITTATDVYALGLILCELLTGSLPYNVSGKSQIEISGIISGMAPVKPSSIVSGRTEKMNGETDQLIKGFNKKQLKKKLRGDLDNIVLKALRKEPERRYGSADQLLQDIRHYQKNEPISARPESAGYLTKKFIQRNRSVVSAAAAITIILIATVIFSLIQARTTEIERQKTEQVNAFLQEMLASPNPYEDGIDVRVVDILDRTAERVDAELNGQPEVESSIRHTLGVTYRELGQIDQAIAQLSGALELQNQLYDPPNANLSETQAQLAKTEQRRGNYEIADSLLNLALESDLQLFGRENLTVAARIGDLGSLEWELGNLGRAEELLRESLALEQKLREPDHERIAISMGNLASLLADRGLKQEALGIYREELEILRANYDDTEHPSIPQAISHIGIILDDFEQFEESREMHNHALELFKQQKGEDHPDVVYAMNNLASVMTKMGDAEEALEMQIDAAELYESIFGPEHPNLGIQYNNIAFSKRNLGDLEGAKESYQKAIDIWKAGLSENHPFLSYGYNNLASVLMTQNRYSEALPNFQKAYEIRTVHFDPTSAELAATSSMLGYCLFKLGQLSEAEPLLVDGYKALSATNGADHTTTKESAERLKEFLTSQDRLDDFDSIAQVQN